MCTYSYPRPGLTCDAAIFTFVRNTLKIVLIERADDPYKGKWALPGGFVDEGETAEEAVVRELKEETGLLAYDLQQVFTATTPGRDPRGWTVSVIFSGFVPEGNPIVKAGDDARSARWFDLDKLPLLAFDHDKIMEKIKEHVPRDFVLTFPAINIFPEKFPIADINVVFYQLTGKKQESEYLTNRLIRFGVIHKIKSDKLYCFDKRIADKIRQRGFLEKNTQ